MKRERSFRSGLLAGIAGTVVLLVIGCLVVVYSGAYNVAATEGHMPFVRWALDTTTRNSVRSHAEGLEPPNLTPSDLSLGAQEFAEYCSHCHAAPGAEPAEWASGMLPPPPHLSHAAQKWSTAEIYWIVKHGIKMSGMPPFGPGHEERKIWSIAAFVKRLPATSAQEYRAMTAGEGEGHSH